MGRTRKKVATFLIYRIASVAHCHERSVRKVLDDEPVKPVTAHAVLCACDALGLRELLPPMV